jgi:hypothetical protein
LKWGVAYPTQNLQQRMTNYYRKGEKYDNSRKPNAENHRPVLGG